ncbi:hypothetical protein [Actinomadura sp. 3N407]
MPSIGSSVNGRNAGHPGAIAAAVNELVHEVGAVDAGSGWRDDD